MSHPAQPAASSRQVSRPAAVPSPQPACGKKYTRLVGKNKVEREYTCEKVKGHDKDFTKDGKTIKGSPHGRINVRRNLEVSDSAVDSFELVPGTEVISVLSGRDRGEKQTKIDTHALQAYEAWVAAGKPKEIKDSPQMRYFVTPDEVEDMRDMIRKGAEFHHKRAQIGTPVPHKSGKLAMHWRVIERTDSPKPSDVRAEATKDREGSSQQNPAPAAS